MRLNSKTTMISVGSSSINDAFDLAFARGEISIPQFRSVFKGRVITMDDVDYDESRSVFYGGIDRHPALIIRAADTTDVSTVLSLARESGLKLAIRSGGHSIAGYGVSDGGIVLDLRDLQWLKIDTKGHTAWAESGLTAAEYTAAAGANGLATGFGDTNSVGIDMCVGA